ncbi:MAG: MFS transporter [Mediterranea sp.]|jgi:FSR family fosmidomycin resistance protein-like MFS transporter|nr:MFS transporter [Mediterranea sp.]
MQSKTHSYLLTLGHLCTDVNQGALSAMLPFIITAYGFSYARASMLVLGCSIISSVVQPLFGWLGDKLQRPWFMSLGILLAGAGISMLGLFSTFVPLFCCTMLTGVGVALFHPEGGRLANVVAGANKGEGIGNFAVGGNLGFAVGPLLVALTFPALGMKGAFLFIIPAIISSVLLLSQVRRFQSYTAIEEERIREAHIVLRDNWREFWKVTTVNILRSVVTRSHLVFIPLYWVAVFSESDAHGSLMLTLFTFTGAFATFVGGRVSDHIGFRNCIVICGALMTASILGFFFAQGNVWLAGALMLCTSIFLNFAYSPVVALSQGYLPNHIGLASGISLGVVVSMGALAAPFLGAIGDKHGLPLVFLIISGVSFLVLLLSLFLKNDKARVGEE